VTPKNGGFLREKAQTGEKEGFWRERRGFLANRANAKRRRLDTRPRESDRLSVHAAFAVFILTGIAMLTLHLRYQIPLFRAISKVEEQSHREGQDWSYWLDRRLRLRLFQDPTAIFSETDSTALRTAKQQVVDWRRRTMSAFPKMIAIMILGFILMAAAGIAEEMFRDQSEANPTSHPLRQHS